MPRKYSDRQEYQHVSKVKIVVIFQQSAEYANIYDERDSKVSELDHEIDSVMVVRDKQQAVRTSKTLNHHDGNQFQSRVLSLSVN